MARPLFHTNTVRFRVAEGLLAAAQAKAEREGMTISELMRQAMRHELRAR